VKVLHKHLTAKGAISSAHPDLEDDLRKIKELQDKVESLIASYKSKYQEKTACLLD
jgi:hypothetical protein